MLKIAKSPFGLPRAYDKVDVDVNVNLSYTSTMTEVQQQKWGVKAFAELFGVTPRTIRFYEDKGLLTPIREGGVRVFDLRDYKRFETIMRGKRMGFTLDGIKSVFDVIGGQITDRDELLRRRQEFQAVTDSLARRREDLNILSNEMKQVIDAIDAHLSVDPENENVAALAARYQSAFDQTLKTHPFEFLSGELPVASNSK